MKIILRTYDTYGAIATDFTIDKSTSTITVTKPFDGEVKINWYGTSANLQDAKDFRALLAAAMNYAENK